MQKIALINCYFGEFPWYFDFFIKSCTTNTTVDFIIFSDSKYRKPLPENIRIIPFSLEQFNQLTTEKLGFEITVDKPYKICDFKPAYGFIFPEYLSDYDFWGMCDIDIVFGRIREFMTDELLDQYDVISTRHDYLSGWFMLFRNTPQINTLFMKSKDYQKVFTSQRHYCFDECNFKYLQLDDNKNNILDIECEIESMEYVIRKEIQQERIRVHFDLIMVDGLTGKMKWDHGILTYGNTFEILLYHLIRYKANDFIYRQLWRNIPDIFYIDKYSFRTHSAKSIKGFYYYFAYNFLRVWKQKAIFSWQYFISAIYNHKIGDKLAVGRFKNKLGDDNIYIDKNEQNMIMLYFANVSIPVYQLIMSTFDKNTFYIKGFSRLKYKYFDFENEAPKIQVIHFDGSIVNFESVF